MAESIKAPNGEQAPHLSQEKGESLIARTSEAFRKMTTLGKTVGIVSVIAITLLCYLGMGKVFKKKRGT